MTAQNKNAAPRTYEGLLEPFSETGSEGVMWSLQEPGKGYDGLHTLQDGDLLTVFNDTAKKDILWQGEVKLEFKRNWRSFENPKYPEIGQQEIGGWWVHGFQEGLDPEKWAQMFFDAKPATVTAKTPGP